MTIRELELSDARRATCTASLKRRRRTALFSMAADPVYAAIGPVTQTLRSIQSFRRSGWREGADDER